MKYGLNGRVYGVEPLGGGKELRLFPRRNQEEGTTVVKRRLSKGSPLGIAEQRGVLKKGGRPGEGQETILQSKGNGYCLVRRMGGGGSHARKGGQGWPE